MTLELIISIEDNIDRLEHTRKCITENLVAGLRCCCGVEDLRDGIIKYKLEAWKENQRYNA